MKKFILYIAFVTMFFSVGCDAGQKTVTTHETDTLIIKTSDKKVHSFNIEIADDAREVQYGLMNRTEMPENHGMLFLFARPAVRQFWMKNTLIPLDMLFIEPDGKIVHIHHNAKPLDETIISSQVPVVSVLEINGGIAERLKIEVGDYIQHKVFSNSLAKE
jgi:uncharacterized membrane protein (UPF0127 family)